MKIRISHFLLLLWALMASCSIIVAEEKIPPPRTFIESDCLEMKGFEDRNLFYFSKDVRVIGNNLLINCDNLEVEALRGGKVDATVGEIGAIQRIQATGNVVIEQSGRKALCGRAEFDPKKGAVVLSENPKVIDKEAEVTGWKIVINTGDRKVKVLSDPSRAADKRATVTLDSLPDFGFDKDQAEKEAEKNRPEDKSPVIKPEAKTKALDETAETEN